MPQIPATLLTVLDRKAKEAAQREPKVGAVANSPSSPAADHPPSAEEPTLSQSESATDGIERAPPTDRRLLPPYPKVIVEFDPHRLKIEMEHWTRLTPRMVNQAMMPIVRELLRLRNVEANRNKRGG